MSSRIFRLIAVSFFLAVAASGASAQTAADTLTNPIVNFSGLPRTYEIAGINIEGAPN